MASNHFLRPLLSRSTGPAWSLRRTADGLVLASAVELARDSASRNRGLLGRDGLPADTALVIAPCSAVHTFGMRFRIDVIFTARDGRVVKIAHDVGPRRLAIAWGAFAAIEMAAGEARRHGINVGDRLEVA